MVYNELLNNKIIHTMKKNYMGIYEVKKIILDHNYVSLPYNENILIPFKSEFYKNPDGTGMIYKVFSHIFNKRLSSVLVNYYNIDVTLFTLVEMLWLQYSHNNIDFDSVNHFKFNINE
jgi:hypothetical protein